MIDGYILPEGWEIVELSDVAKKVTDGSHNPPKGISEGIPMISAKDVENNKISFESPRYISQIDFEAENRRTQIESGDILLTIVATIGRTAVVAAKTKPFTLQRSVAVIKTVINSSLLCYYFQSPLFQRQLANSAKGTAQKGVYLKTLNSLKVVLPPENQHVKIVFKIEELFSELDKGIEELKTAQQQLKVYRQAVLKWAFEGKLTNEDVKDGELPKGWKFSQLGEIIEQPKYGTSKKCDYQEVGKGVLRIPNIKGGKVDDSDLKYAEFDNDEIETYRLKEGDLLTIRSNGSVDIVGQCALITRSSIDYLYAGYLIRLRPLQSLIDPHYLLYVLTSSNLRNQIESKAKSTSGVNNINSDELKSLIVPICTIEEQQQIVQEIESRLSVCDKIEETITASLKQAEALRQSILKKAFEGKLDKEVNSD